MEPNTHNVTVECPRCGQWMGTAENGEGPLTCAIGCLETSPREEWKRVAEVFDDSAGTVTRVEVIDEGGRRFSRWGCRVELSYQDDGRTLKLFVSDNPDAPKGPTPTGSTPVPRISQATEEPPSVGAVDPQASSTGKPSTREKETVETQGRIDPSWEQDVAEIRSSYGYLMMRIAVASDAQDAYDVCKKEFAEHENAFRRLGAALGIKGEWPPPPDQGEG